MGSQKSVSYDLYTLDYGQVIIKLKRYNELSKTKEKVALLQRYLFPAYAIADKKDITMQLPYLIILPVVILAGRISLRVGITSLTMYSTHRKR